MYPAPFNFNPPRIANANIRPCRILAAVAGTENAVVEATGVTVPLVGVSKNRLKYAFGSFEAAAVPFIAETNDAVDYYGPGQQGEVLSGGAITNLTRPLTSDAQGRAISTAAPAAPGTTVNWIIGFPVDTAAAADEQIRVWIVSPQIVLV